MDRIIAYDPSRSLNDFLTSPEENGGQNAGREQIRNFRRHFEKNAQHPQMLTRGYGALGGTRTPTILLTATSRQRVYQFRHERYVIGPETSPGRSNGAGCNKSAMGGQGLVRGHGNLFWGVAGLRRRPKPGWSLFGEPVSTSLEKRLSDAGAPGQHLLDLDRDPVAVDQHDAAGDRQIIGEYLDLVGLGGIQLDDGAATQAHYLMNRHRCGAEHHHEINRDFIERWHWNPDWQPQNCAGRDHHVMVSQWLTTARTSI
jgi:hypothetical protein